MIALKASEIATIVGGKLIGDDVLVTANPTLNSQDAVPGSLFIAIKGERVDGHDFAQSAFERGAVLAFAERSIPTRHILVKNSTAALGRLAKEVRARLNQMQVIAITGSQGKTTTKELLTAILSSHAPTVAPQGNFNNELGLPLSLLRCNETTQYAIVEMGARHIGGSPSNRRLTNNQAGALGLALCLPDGLCNCVSVVTINRANHIPTVGLKPLGGIVSKPTIDMPINRDAVVVIKANQFI